MNKIKILPPQEAQKIAAGEVVERPSSVVKEIIENAIDAQANSISLYVKKSGKELIRLVDNGCGMSLEDAKICFAPHATSKIRSLTDLEQIQSFGFRGEALATISAVSKVELITKNNDLKDTLGIKLEYISGKITKQEEVACGKGTDLQIKDLFYNTPVRKKFLKQDETEWNQILSIFQAFCLSNLSINFKLFRDEKLFLNAPSTNNLKDRACQLWGHNLAQNLIELSPQKEDDEKKVKLTGLISNHNFWRYGRNQIFFFANSRAVKNKELSKALLKGYLNVLPPGRFPAAFISLNMENDLLDINVHPRKEEVKFAKPVTVELALQKLVTQSLENHLTKQLKPVELEIKSDFISNNISNSKEEPKLINLEQNKTNDFSQIPTFINKPQEEILTAQNFLNQHPYTPKDNFKQVNEDKPITYANKQIESSNNFRIIGQLLKTYILIEKDTELLMIDQHAAHERILYEKFLNKFEKKEGTNLLFPEIVNLTKNQIELLLKEKSFFDNQGIQIDHFGENQIAIKTSPPKIQNHSLKELVIEFVTFLEENEHLEEEDFRKKLNEHMHTQMACKMAIKAGDNLSLQQMQQLINDLQKTNNRFICAHGRPTTWNLKKYQIEKNFRRK